MLDERYELGSLLGRGGMADVYRAHDRLTGADVAVKVFRPGVELLDAAARRRREAQVALSLDHPGLVRLLDERQTGDGPAYLVMELVEGETLGAAVRRQPLTEEAVLQLGAALCAALAHVHSRGIVHRDVKPANVLVTVDGQPKLTDFGVARGLDSTRMTVEGFTVGTANYLSPEQVTGTDVAFASDVYSLGLVLIEALTGQLVFPGHGVEAAVVRLHRDPAVPAGISPQLAGLLTAMTAREPSRRPSAAVAGRRFEQLLDPEAPTSPWAVRPRRRAAVALGTLGSLAAGTVTLAVLLTSGGSTPAAQARDIAPVPISSESPVAAEKTHAARPTGRVTGQPTHGAAPRSKRGGAHTVGAHAKRAPAKAKPHARAKAKANARSAKHPPARHAAPKPAGTKHKGPGKPKGHGKSKH